MLDGQTWASCEHYFQAAKFADAPAYREKVRQAESPGASWALGQTRHVRIRGDWEVVKGYVMYQAVRAKYEQHPEIAAELAGRTPSAEDLHIHHGPPSRDFAWTVFDCDSDARRQ